MSVEVIQAQAMMEEPFVIRAQQFFDKTANDLSRDQWVKFKEICKASK